MSIGQGLSHLESQDTDSDWVILEERGSIFLICSRHCTLGWSGPSQSAAGKETLASGTVWDFLCN